MSSFPSASLAPDTDTNAQASSSRPSHSSTPIYTSSRPNDSLATDNSSSAIANGSTPDGDSPNGDSPRPSRKDRLATSLHHRLRALNIPPNLHSMTAGAGAGLVASIITCPLDVVKTRLQAQHVSKNAGYEGFGLTVTRIWGQSGLRGFYRGLGPTVGGYLPTWGIYFTVYDLVKDRLGNWRSGGGDHQAPQSTLVHITAAMTAGATGTIMTNPLWVVKTRFMAQAVLPPSGARYRNTFDAIRTIYKQEGFGAFYKGLLPSLMGVTHVAVQFPLYEAFKSWADPDGNQSSLSPSTILICSAASKMIASLATYPHEVLRTRLQIAKASSSSSSTSSSSSSSSSTSTSSNGTRHLYSPLNTGSNPPHPQEILTHPVQSANSWVSRRRKGGIVDTAIKIKRQDGWRGFYRGLFINLVRTVPNSAVTMLSYPSTSDEYDHCVQKLNQIKKRAPDRLNWRIE